MSAPEADTAHAVEKAIQTGDLAALTTILDAHPELAQQRIHGGRTLLHVATDWPGHFPNSAAAIRLLISRGADVNARFTGPPETALHWAASSNDVEALDALLDGGADIEVNGAVIGGGTPLADAAAFGQWNAARRLVERGATTTIWQAAALGLMDRVARYFDPGPSPLATVEVTRAFWAACHGGHQATAEYLLDRGAELNWVGFDHLTPFDIASRSGSTLLTDWLRTRGAKSVAELQRSA